ncbi:MAG: zinc ribbon domain-containing protein [Thermoanaerobaculia bacterium]
MNSVLEQLYRLQDRIQFVRERLRERDTVPAELVEVDREFRERVEAVERLKARLAEAGKEARKAEAELADHREKLKKYQTQLRSVQSSREYSAVLNEIDGVEKLVRATEERQLSLEEEIEAARADLTAREQNLPAETEQHEEKLKDWRAAQRAINDQLAAAEAEIQRLEAEISPRDRSEFHRLLDKKRGLAVSRVIQIASSYSCSACHVKIRPAALQLLKAGREIVYCDSCKRILYYAS